MRECGAWSDEETGSASAAGSEEGEGRNCCGDGPAGDVERRLPRADVVLVEAED